jgi:epoxyqueuosine reductase
MNKREGVHPSMVTKADIIEAAQRFGFADVGFTTAEPFEEHHQTLLQHREEYQWIEKHGLDLIDGTDPIKILPTAKSIVVLLEVYFKLAYPPSVEGYFGRCYLDDDRVTHDGLTRRIKEFRLFLGDNGIDSKVPPHLPHRAAAIRAGMGTIGKNCLLYSNTAARGGSWTIPFPVIIDAAMEPDPPSTGLACPNWCRNACIAACPTRALIGNGRMDPRKCISYLSYFGEGLTPLELREPMGMYVYGCDRCQDVCPLNQPWLAQALPVNPKVAAKADDFDLSKLLHMDMEFFKNRIWPHMFYMPHKDIWRWKMNVARVMGNSRDNGYLPELKRAYEENPDERVRAMAVWAIGKIGGSMALAKTIDHQLETSDLVLKEIRQVNKYISP